VGPTSFSWRNLLTFLPQVGGVSELKWRAGLGVLARNAFRNGADERKNTGQRLSSVTPIFCDKFFQCNGYIFLRSLKPAIFHVSKSF
jgi:hypothetical protein